MGSKWRVFEDLCCVTLAENHHQSSRNASSSLLKWWTEAAGSSCRKRETCWNSVMKWQKGLLECCLPKFCAESKNRKILKSQETLSEVIWKQDVPLNENMPSLVCVDSPTAEKKKKKKVLLVSQRKDFLFPPMWHFRSSFFYVELSVTNNLDELAFLVL